MNIVKIDKNNISNGTGVRVAVFVSGCDIHCEGCHNPEAWDPKAGKVMTGDVIMEILDACDRPEIQGISILGGEPLRIPRNRVGVYHLLYAFRQRFDNRKDVWLYTGMTHESVQAEMKLKTLAGFFMKEVIDRVDVLVTEPFILNQKEAGLKFKGSRNQRIIDMRTGKYLFPEDN